MTGFCPVALGSSAPPSGVRITSRKCEMEKSIWTERHSFGMIQVLCLFVAFAASKMKVEIAARFWYNDPVNYSGKE